MTTTTEFDVPDLTAIPPEMNFEVLFRRHQAACKMDQGIDWPRVVSAVTTWYKRLYGEKALSEIVGARPIKTVDNFNSLVYEHPQHGGARVLWVAGQSEQNPHLTRLEHTWKTIQASRERLNLNWYTTILDQAYGKRTVILSTARRISSIGHEARDRNTQRARQALRYRHTSWEDHSHYDLMCLSALAVYAAQIGDVASFHIWYPLLEAFEAGGWLMFGSEKGMHIAPVVAHYHRDDQYRLHSAEVPAFEWMDFKAYCWKDRVVPDWIILFPDRLSAEVIDRTRNVELRRVMIERYGFDRYLADTHTTLIHQDETGSLYIRQFEDDEDLAVVKVKNSTPEPTGEFKDYYLRVPPTILTARAAVAWTFGMTADEYRLAFES